MISIRAASRALVPILCVSKPTMRPARRLAMLASVFVSGVAV
jgi:hypothetical protein